MIDKNNRVVEKLRERIISVVLKMFEVEHLRIEARAGKFTPVGFHLSDITVSSAQQLSFACVLSLEADHCQQSGNAKSYEMEVFGQVGFESPHWEIQHISDVRASAQQTLRWS